ncbi:MAG: hypothetical protein OXH76_09985 [Boseongicola sp.]|uniref:Uncharacterized protein n=1 Tax=Boseongicola sp. SB0664_bin_43 TaxID=2604844 RepID=A0A6B0XXT7_9RHOB|nr:hypothetical protein [Boseongicola sp.]MXY33501.1 hypothetical protein [Boseongicola sp. SB0664_bin_43]
MERVSLADGSWTRLCHQWEHECDSFGEAFDEFTPASFSVLDDLARGTPFANAGVFAASNDNDYVAAFHANVAFLPNYEGKVLRIRHIVFAPRYDLDPNMKMEDYAGILVAVFAGAIILSNDVMAAPHIKFHLRSPVERQYGDLFTKALNVHEVFKEATMQGAWIYVSKI